MTSQPGKQTIAIHILPYISRSKFVQLIEYNMRKIILEKTYPKCGGETSPKPFPEKSKLSISLGQNFKILHILFVLYSMLRAIELY